VPALAGATPRHRRIALVAALLAAGLALGVLADRTLGTRATDPPTYRRLTFDRGTVGRARFAPDGQTIVYDAAWDGKASEVFTTRVDSRESRSLGSRGTVFALSSSSELAIGLGTQQGPGLSTLSRVPLAGGAPREVLENVGWADWSPDGADLAVVHYVEGVARLEFPIGKVLYESRGNITHARVSPGGDRVAFIAHDDRASSSAPGPS